jgi:hypothetical protein
MANLTATEVALQTYAHNLVMDNVKMKEYDGQITSWKKYINSLADALEDALDQQKKALDKARQQIEAEREARFGMAMLVLSMVSGPALSWLAGKIQYKWYPKYASTVKMRTEKVLLEGPATANVKFLTTQTLDHDKVWAKIFGDVGKQVVGWGTDKAIKVMKPDPEPAKAAIDKFVNGAPQHFKTTLENALMTEAGLTSEAIEDVAISINMDDDYGPECLKKLKRVNPRARAHGG